jgi:hypothetical protein
MKIKLTPELAYIIGLWRKRRVFDGLGVRGDKERLELFSSCVLEQNMTTPEKLISDESKVFFYHSAYRKFFSDIEQEQIERFRYLNEYAANYLGGLFDSVGGIDDKGVVYLEKTNRQDEMLLVKLGFGARKRKDRLVIEKPRAFLAFIKNYVRLFKDHKAFEYVKNNGRKKG